MSAPSAPHVRCFGPIPFGFGELPTSAFTLDVLSQALPGGAYTTFRTYHGDCALQLTGHITRLSESAAVEGHSLPLDELEVRRQIACAVQACAFPESRIRLTLAYDPPGALYISLERFEGPPERAYREGVRCATAPAALRRQLPSAKSTSFIGPASEARAGTEVQELLLTGGSTILEGSSSNFFAVLDGTLRTAGEGVLAGITRGTILRLAEGLLPIVLEPIALVELPRLQEAFISSVSRAVLPVTAIDDRAVGNGIPGPITLELGRRFGTEIERAIQPIAP